MLANVSVKNGDEYGDHDLRLAEIDFEVFPVVGDTLEIHKRKSNGMYEEIKCLVREIKHSVVQKKENDEYRQYATVYVSVFK